MESEKIPGPATLWGILTPDCGEASVDGDMYEAEYDSSDAAYTDSQSDDELRTPHFSECAEASPAGPATLWGILLSKVELAAAEQPDKDTIVNLWLAAGYECAPALEGEEEPLSPISPISVQPSYPPDPPPGPYTIASSPNKGLGMFSTRPIPKGSHILSDTPFLLISKPYTNHTILSTFESMSLPQRQQYMQLFCPDRPDCFRLPDVQRIFYANNFSIGDHAAIFLTATRFNHSCLPNTYYSWNEVLNQLEFHAMVDLTKGEELTICYCHPLRSRQGRTEELLIYNFRCMCSACDLLSAFGQASEERRSTMEGLEEQIQAFQWRPDSDEAVQENQLVAVLRLIELIKEEGLQGELMGPYRDVADLLRLKGRYEEALAYARLELEEEVVCLGEQSPVVGDTRAYIRDIENERALEEAKGGFRLEGDGEETGEPEQEKKGIAEADEEPQELDHTSQQAS